MEKKRKKVLPTDHDWNYPDCEVSHYATRLKRKIAVQFKTKNELFIWAELDRQLQKKFSLTFKQLAEDVIGCSEGSLADSIQVYEYLITKNKKPGYYHPNKYQKTIEAAYMGSFLDLEADVSKIIHKFQTNFKRQIKNSNIKSLRVQATFDKKNKLGRKSILLEAKNLTAKNAQNNPRNVKPLSSFTNKKVSKKIGSFFTHKRFGRGKILSVDGITCKVDFSGIIKVIVNDYINKKK